jgi:hypothetical protein
MRQWSVLLVAFSLCRNLSSWLSGRSPPSPAVQKTRHQIAVVPWWIPVSWFHSLQGLLTNCRGAADLHVAKAFYLSRPVSHCATVRSKLSCKKAEAAAAPSLQPLHVRYFWKLCSEVPAESFRFRSKCFFSFFKPICFFIFFVQESVVPDY